MKAIKKSAEFIRRKNEMGMYRCCSCGKPIYNIQTNLSIGVFTEEEGYVRLNR